MFGMKTREIKMADKFNTTKDTSSTIEWLTPPEIVKNLGEFDLDPCAPESNKREWEHATTSWSLEENGDSLAFDCKWFGRVFLNPPYGAETFKWIAKLAEHGNGLALIFARTDTRGFHKEVFEKAEAIFFIKSRLKFYRYWTQEVENKQTKAKHPIYKTINMNGDILNNNTLILPNNGPNAPSCLIAYGKENVKLLENFKYLKGHLVRLK
jgi:hypothetical protein